MITKASYNPNKPTADELEKHQYHKIEIFSASHKIGKLCALVSCATCGKVLVKIDFANGVQE